jgi:phosphoribosylformylglycinamidine cyclo-ligase
MSVTYKSSGVDIDQANAFVRSIQGHVKATFRPEVLQARGGFGGLFRLGKAGGKDRVLVSSTDGVGTKLLVAQAAGRHDTVGIDLVAMNVNDILCCGAEPLFFLDYIACGRLDPAVLKDVVKGVAAGCRQSGCALIGGETAEMPGMYGDDEYDLAGFAVGIVEKKKLIDGSGIRPGDRVVGLASSGLHSNGYSLARKALPPDEQKALAGELLKPTRIYVRPVRAVLERVPVKGIAHITGGAYYEKLTKVLPAGTCFRLDRGAWPVPKIFSLIRERGGVPREDMYKTFNMGIGMALVVRPGDVSRTRAVLSAGKVRSYMIGEVVKARGKVKVEFLDG